VMAAIGMISVVVVVCVCLLVGWGGVRGDGGGVVLWDWGGGGCEGWGWDGDGRWAMGIGWDDYTQFDDSKSPREALLYKIKNFPKPQNDAALPLKTSYHDPTPALSIQHLVPECNDTKAPP